MAPRKTTLYIDDDVLTAAKLTAVATHRSESAVVEDALRAYLNSGHGAAAQADLRDVLDRIAASGTDDLSDDDALATAVGEVRAARTERPGRKAG